MASIETTEGYFVGALVDRGTVEFEGQPPMETAVLSMAFLEVGGEGPLSQAPEHIVHLAITDAQMSLMIETLGEAVFGNIEELPDVDEVKRAEMMRHIEEMLAE